MATSCLGSERAGSRATRPCPHPRVDPGPVIYIKVGSPINRDEFHTHLEEFLGNEGKRSKRAWVRVLRRYVTACRQLRDDTLCVRALGLLEDHPGLGRYLLDYLASFPLTSSRVESVIDYASRNGGVYEDIDLLLHEYICLAPADDTTSIRELIAEWSLGVISGLYEKAPRQAASACLSFAKFAPDEHLARFAEKQERWLAYDSVARQQAVVVLVAKQYLPTEDLAKRVSDPGVESSRHLRFLRALGQKDEGAIDLCLKLLKPINKRDPDRVLIRPRALLLVPTVRAAAPARWMAAADGWRKQMTTLPEDLRDKGAERWCGL